SHASIPRRSCRRVGPRPPSGKVGLFTEPPAAQHLRDAPRLRDAAATGVRLLRVEDLRDAADTEVVEVADQPLEQRARLGCALRIDAAERVDGGTDQPGPYRALVVRGVTSAQVAPVARSVPRRPWCERSQPDRSKQLARDDIEHLPPA